MRRRWSNGLIAGSIALLAGCGDRSPAEPGRSDLEIARARWIAHRPEQYAFNVRKACFCAVTGEVRVYVRHDSVLAVVGVPDARAIDTRNYESIEQLFDFIERAISNHAAVIRATYDPVLGYPTSIDYDGAANIADDEVSYTLSDVTPAYFTVDPPQPSPTSFTERRPPPPLAADPHPR